MSVWNLRDIPVRSNNEIQDSWIFGTRFLLNFHILELLGRGWIEFLDAEARRRWVVFEAEDTMDDLQLKLA